MNTVKGVEAVVVAGVAGGLAALFAVPAAETAPSKPGEGIMKGFSLVVGVLLLLLLTGTVAAELENEFGGGGAIKAVAEAVTALLAAPALDVFFVANVDGSNPIFFAGGLDDDDDDDDADVSQGASFR